MLLAHGADPQIEGERKNTALHLACERGHRNIIKLLIEHHVSIYSRNLQGKRPWEVVPDEMQDREDLINFIKSYPTALKRRREEARRFSAKVATDFCDAVQLFDYASYRRQWLNDVKLEQRKQREIRLQLEREAIQNKRRMEQAQARDNILEEDLEVNSDEEEDEEDDKDFTENASSSDGEEEDDCESYDEMDSDTRSLLVSDSQSMMLKQLASDNTSETKNFEPSQIERALYVLHRMSQQFCDPLNPAGRVRGDGGSIRSRSQNGFVLDPHALIGIVAFLSKNWAAFPWKMLVLRCLTKFVTVRANAKVVVEAQAPSKTSTSETYYRWGSLETHNRTLVRVLLENILEQEINTAEYDDDEIDKTSLQSMSAVLKFVGQLIESVGCSSASEQARTDHQQNEEDGKYLAYESVGRDLDIDIGDESQSLTFASTDAGFASTEAQQWPTYANSLNKLNSFRDIVPQTYNDVQMLQEVAFLVEGPSVEILHRCVRSQDHLVALDVFFFLQHATKASVHTILAPENEWIFDYTAESLDSIQHLSKVAYREVDDEDFTVRQSTYRSAFAATAVADYLQTPRGLQELREVQEGNAVPNRLTPLIQKFVDSEQDRAALAEGGSRGHVHSSELANIRCEAAMDFIDSLVTSGLQNHGTVVVQPWLNAAGLIMVERGVIGRLLSVLTFRAVGVRKVLKSIANFTRCEEVQRQLYQSNFGEQVLDLLNISTDFQVGSWSLFSVSHLLRQPIWQRKMAKLFITRKQSHVDLSEESQIARIYLEDLVMKWAQLALSLVMPSDTSQVVVPGHPSTYSSNLLNTPTRDAYTLLARCLHVLLGLCCDQTTAERILECGGVELCAGVLCHPSFEVSYTAFILLQEIMRDHYDKTLLSRMVARLTRKQHPSTMWMSVTYGSALGLKPPTLRDLVAGCETFLRVTDHLAVRRRDPRTQIAFGVLCSLARNSSVREVITGLSDWKKNLLSEVLENYHDSRAVDFGIEARGSYPSAWRDRNYELRQANDPQPSDFLPEELVATQRTSLRGCALRSCTNVETQANTFITCQRCHLAAFCCRQHQAIAWKTWHYKDCKIAKDVFTSMTAAKFQKLVAQNRAPKENGYRPASVGGGGGSRFQKFSVAPRGL